MRVSERTIEILADNLANVGTTGFKRKGIFVRELIDARRTIDELRGRDVADDAPWRSYVDFEQGELRHTRQPLDLAISGEAWFELRGPEGTTWTRNGHFALSGSGGIVDTEGRTLMGQGGPITVSPDAKDIVIDESGRVYEDGRLVDQIRLVRPPGAGEAAEEPGPGEDPAMPGEAEEAAPGVTVRQGYLERSNVKPMNELIHLIEHTRNYDVGQRMLRLQDEILRGIVTRMAALR
jgi:flagellar basal body rod protein FlgG